MELQSVRKLKKECHGAECREEESQLWSKTGKTITKVQSITENWFNKHLIGLAERVPMIGDHCKENSATDDGEAVPENQISLRNGVR